MITRYLKTAWRQLLVNKFYSGISLLGLVIGLSVSIMILIWVQNKLNYNEAVNPQGDIYRINSVLESGGRKNVWSNTPAPVAVFAKSDIPEVKQITRVMSNWDYSLFSYKEHSVESENAVFVDSDFFTLFNVRFLAGSSDNPIPSTESVVITQSMATKLFGNQDPIGKTIEAERRDKYTVAAVIADLPKNSSINFDVLFTTKLFALEYTANSYWKAMDLDWGNFYYSTYVQLDPNASKTAVLKKFTEINKKHDPNAHKNHSELAYSMQNMNELNLYYANGDNADIKVIQLFSLIAILILIIASINYINLSTARALKRAKEVSVRKIIGAEKYQLFTQFIVESLLFFGIALLLSLGLIVLLLPKFSALIGNALEFDFSNTHIWKVIFMTALATLVASSVYPAMLLSSFKPIQALKGKISSGVGANTFRKVLVSIQFVFSVILIVGTLVIGQQLNYMQSLDPGYNKAQVFTFGMREGMHDHFDVVVNELKNHPLIDEVATTRSLFINNGNGTGDTNWDGKDPDKMFVVSQFGIDESFIPLMDIEIKEGDNFKGIATDSTHFILNETAVKKMGIENPVGKRFVFHDVEGRIGAVVKDFHFRSLKSKVPPAVLYYAPEGYRLYLKLKGENTQAVLASVEKLWNTYNTGFPFHYKFIDEQYDTIHREDKRTGDMFKWFSLIAIFVSCLGLFALVTYSSQLKVKEIGIRKVLGASVAQITYMLSQSFIKIVGLAILIATPIAYYLMDNWLQDFSYRIELQWWYFVLAGVLAITIALFTVSFQSVKAALSNPVKSLRTE